MAEKEAHTDRTELERFFAEERQIMAKTWRLTDEQAVEFDMAARDAHAERQGIFARMTRDKLSSIQVSEQLTAVNKRANQRLLEVLGPDRLLEYHLTAGAFVEAGMDKKPFTPPRWEPARQTQNDDTQPQAKHTVGTPGKGEPS
jgi:hypothetical protein